jgi:signal transduction histidine kinase
MLVTPSGAKIAHTIRDLAFYAQTREEDLARVLEKLANVRILRPVAPPLDQPQTLRYEIFHDVLAPAVLDWRARFVEGQRRAEESEFARERAEKELRSQIEIERAIIEERTRIAREIHDGIAQDLSYLVLKIGLAQKLLSQGKEEDVQEELRQVLDQLRRDAREVRRIIYALRPLDIETQGFMPALKQFVQEFGQVNDIDMTLNLQGNPGSLPPKIEATLFRLVQESLDNIRKYAKAKQVWIDLIFMTPNRVSLRVQDNGKGFDDASTEKRERTSFVQIRERAERAGGTVSFKTEGGKGTTIRVELPISEQSTNVRDLANGLVH